MYLVTVGILKTTQFKNFEKTYFDCFQLLMVFFLLKHQKAGYIGIVIASRIDCSMNQSTLDIKAIKATKKLILEKVPSPKSNFSRDKLINK